LHYLGFGGCFKGNISGVDDLLSDDALCSDFKLETVPFYRSVYTKMRESLDDPKIVNNLFEQAAKIIGITGCRFNLQVNSYNWV
jgi:hypothetical protein